MYLVFPTHAELARYTSQKLKTLMLSAVPTTVGLATGSTMEPVYANLIQSLQSAGSQDFKQLVSFNLDEYVGLNRQHPQSYRYYMQQHLFDHIGLPDEQTFLPDGSCTDIDEQCAWYSQAIQQRGGLDFQLLGIGTNGHIGFNEPGTPFDSRTHVVELSEQTRIDNGRFFDDFAEVPTHAITLGIADIMEAKEVWLLITGEHKAQTVLNYHRSAVDENMPASVLKRHPNTHILLDQAAASLLPAEVQTHYRTQAA